jgi:CheY-specific phosphatase CheX
MMKNEDRKVLCEVCFGVFEQLAFMFGEELEEEDIETDADTFIKATMGFSGPQQGTVSIVVPGTITSVMAANILGLDEDQPIEKNTALDALKELLNTITGRLLTSLFGEELVIDLTIPQTQELDRASWNELVENNEFIAIAIEDNPVLITFQSQ